MTAAPDCTCDPRHTEVATFDRGCKRHDTKQPPPGWNCPDCGVRLMVAAYDEGAWTRAFVAWAGHDCKPRPHAIKTPVPVSSEGNADRAPGTTTSPADTWRDRWRRRAAAIKTWPIDATDLRS